MPRFGSQIDTSGIPVKSLVPETGTAFPGSPIANQIFTRSDLNQTFQYLNGSWVQLDNSGGAAVPASRLVATGTGLTGGGDLSADRTLSLADTAVTTGSYGSATAVSTFTVDAQGRLTAAGSTAIQVAESQVTNLTTDLAAKAPLASPALTGVPTAPTAAAGTNTTQVATTAFVGTAVANLVASAPGTLDTLNELASALGDDPNFATTMTNDLAKKAGKYTSASQNLVAGTPVTITHNLSTSDPVVSFYDSTGPLVLDYTISSANAISVTAAIAVTGMICTVEG